MLPTRTRGTQGLSASALGLETATLDTGLAPDRIAGPRRGEKLMALVDR